MNTKGKLGESIACYYLVSKGYTILHRNWVCKFSELDIIAKKGDILVFVEVKYRCHNKLGTIFEALSKRKVHKLHNAINYYLYVTKNILSVWGLDFIGVVRTGNKCKIVHEHVSIE